MTGIHLTSPITNSAAGTRGSSQDVSLPIPERMIFAEYSMRAYPKISSTLFGLIALGHLLRLLLHWPAEIAGQSVPIWASVMGWVKANLAAGAEVPGVVVARSIDERLRFAAAVMPTFVLLEYEVEPKSTSWANTLIPSKGERVPVELIDSGSGRSVGTVSDEQAHAGSAVATPGE